MVVTASQVSGIRMISTAIWRSGCGFPVTGVSDGVGRSTPRQIVFCVALPAPSANFTPPSSLAEQEAEPHFKPPGSGRAQSQALAEPCHPHEPEAQARALG